MKKKGNLKFYGNLIVTAPKYNYKLTGVAQGSSSSSSSLGIIALGAIIGANS